MPLRSYIYISKTKVDSLYEQIPRKQLKQLAKKLTIDLKVIKAEFGADEREESLVARTQIVERYLDHEGVVADVDAAGQDDDVEYFRGRLPLTWSAGRSNGGIYFSGRTDETVMVLGGSGRNLVSAAAQFGIDAPDKFFSATPILVEGMALELHPPDRPVQPNDLAGMVMSTYAQMHDTMPETKMGFLAVPMAIAPVERGAANALLGSPLYVSLKH